METPMTMFHPAGFSRWDATLHLPPCCDRRRSARGSYGWLDPMPWGRSETKTDRFGGSWWFLVQSETPEMDSILDRNMDGSGWRWREMIDGNDGSWWIEGPPAVIQVSTVNMTNTRSTPRHFLQLPTTFHSLGKLSLTSAARTASSCSSYPRDRAWWACRW